MRYDIVFKYSHSFTNVESLFKISFIKVSPGQATISPCNRLPASGHFYKVYRRLNFYCKHSLWLRLIQAIILGLLRIECWGKKVSKKYLFGSVPSAINFFI